MDNRLDARIVEFVRAAANGEHYAAYLKKTLNELVRLNTAPDADLAATAAREKTFFDWVEREVTGVAGPGVTVERPEVNPAIAGDPAYSPTGYAAGPDGQGPASQAGLRRARESRDSCSGQSRWKSPRSAPPRSRGCGHTLVWSARIGQPRVRSGLMRQQGPDRHRPRPAEVARRIEGEVRIRARSGLRDPTRH